MIWVLIVLAVLFIPFGLVVLLGAPYLPAHKKAINDALSLIKPSKNGRVLDLGCGDGKFLVAAAKKGYKCTGYEINIILFLIVKFRLLKHRDADVKLGSFWSKDFPKDTEVAYVFLLDKFMNKLDGKMKIEAKRLKKNLSLVSYVFKIPGKKSIKEVGGVRVYEYSIK